VKTQRLKLACHVLRQSDDRTAHVAMNWFYQKVVKEQEADLTRPGV